MIVLTAFASAVLAIAIPKPSSGYAHDWSCVRGSANTCTDTTGQQYNSWRQVVADMGDFISVYEVCAKGRTAAGNVRNGAGNGCWNNTFYRQTCFYPETPQTEAYVYWGGSGGSRTINGNAQTPATATVC